MTYGLEFLTIERQLIRSEPHYRTNVMICTEFLIN